MLRLPSRLFALLLVLLSSAANATPLVQARTQLIGSLSTSFDAFGLSVSVSGDTLAVGATDQYVYLFERGQGGPDHWGESAFVGLSKAQLQGRRFGLAVAVSGDILVVAAPIDSTSRSPSGAAYVFERNHGGANAWGQVAELTPADPAAAPRFGSSVAVDGDTVVVGAAFFNDPSQLDGSVHVFKRNQGGSDHWGEVRSLDSADPADLFGGAVAIQGDILIVGASRDHERGWDAGAAYVFERDRGGPEQWGEVRKLTAADAAGGDQFGGSVALDGDTAVVGASHKGGTGAAYVFERGRGGADAWGQARRLAGSQIVVGDVFGYSVAIEGDTVVAGSPRPTLGSGANAYVFKRHLGGAEAWGEAGRLATSGYFAFGSSVAVTGGTAVVGDPFSDHSRSNLGYAFIYDLAGFEVAIPALGPLGLVALAILLGSAGWRLSARRRRS